MVKLTEGSEEDALQALKGCMGEVDALRDILGGYQDYWPKKYHEQAGESHRLREALRHISELPEDTQIDEIISFAKDILQT
jgi:hypothetical protein